MKQVLALFLLLLSVSFIFCAPVGSNQAIRVAENWMLERSGQSYSNSQITPLFNDSSNNLIYLVSLEPRGYVLVAGDDAASPIIGYNTTHDWGEYEIPIQLQYLLQNWQDQLQSIKDNQFVASPEVALLWKKYDKAHADFTPNRNFRDVSPLIQSTWGQEGYYNDMCPSNTPVGCVATAMSQIMHYWSYPSVGQGSHTYTHPIYGVQTANFGTTTYSWSSMPNQVSSPNTSVATLCYHAGVAVEMDYHPTGSGAYSSDVPGALISYFRYKDTAIYRYKYTYSESNWNTMLQGELNNSRPIHYSGNSEESGGHAFILDGYQGSNHYHFNWGWNGYYNGYYYLTALNPGTYDFTSNQAAVFGIEPSSTSSLTLSEGFEGTTFPPTGWTISNGGDTNTWVRDTETAYVRTGSACASINYSASAHNDWLITPRLTPSADNYTFSFWARNRSVSYIDRFNVKLSTTTNAVASFTTTLASNVGPGAAYSQYSYNLSSYIGQDIYLAIQAISTDMWELYIDDVVGPPLWVDPNPTAGLNINSWNAGSTTPGSSVSSGNIFQLSNQGQGILTITSMTNLSATEFSTNLNPGIALVPGQVHEFGFVYEPLNYGTDNQSFQIVTNGGTLSITLTGQASNHRFSDDFESYMDFSLDFAPWTQHDGDGSTTYSIDGYSFTNDGYTGSFIIFNSSQTSPSLAGTPADAHGGFKGAYCFASTAPPNNDWLISPRIDLTGPTCSVSFWAKSYTAEYGLERFKVLYSTTTNVYTSFTNYLAGSASAYISAPDAWTQYTYTLPTTAKYVAIQCVANDSFIFMVDDFIISDSGYTPPTPVFGSINGYVYKYGTSTPIPNALVQVGSKSATTNSAGFYQINNLMVGTYGGSCSAPGTDYFVSSVSGINITEGGMANQDFELKWAELSVNATSFTVDMYQGQTTNQSLIISNTGGTADLVYDWYYSPYTGSTRQTPGKAVPVDPRRQISGIPSNPDRTDITGWMNYATIQDVQYLTSYVPERATKFVLSDYGPWSDSGVTISQLEAYFYNHAEDPWGTETTFRFKIYAADGSTVLHSSAMLTANPQTTVWNPTTYTLDPPLTVTSDFWVAVQPVGSTSGKPYGLSAAYSRGHSYYGSAGNWTALADEEHIISVNIDGNYWVYANPTTGVVAPGQSETVIINFDATNQNVGTAQSLLTIVNNSTYIAPSGRGDDLRIPLTLNVLAGATLGSVEGHVYLAGTTTPVENAVVSLPFAEPVFTNASGYYIFENVVTLNNDTISASANGCQDYSSELELIAAQTITKDIYLDWSAFSASPNPIVISCAPGASTSAITTISNPGNYALDWETAWGVWGGPLHNTGALNQNFDDYDLTGWSGMAGPSSDIYTGFGHSVPAAWVFASDGMTEPQYLISPMLKPDADDLLSFWYQQFNDSDEVLQILISRTDDAIGSFLLWDTINMTTANQQVWAQYSRSLAEYAEEDHIYICFYYPRVDSYQYGYVLIDDILGPDAYLPYSDWLSATATGSLAAGGSNSSFTLNADATALPLGTYTAQVWLYGDAINSPYKIYVTLNVEDIVIPDPPQNLVCAAYDTYFELAWDDSDGAALYHILISDQPDGEYQELLSTSNSFVEITWAQITAAGFSSGADRAFFKVTADTQPTRTQGLISSKDSTRMPLKLFKKGMSQPLNRLD
ncbi:MAG: C10 family peptidase [Candidatus Cloacimonetes bacterium]|nr:C10 family peptidase [Candidatus Cloacimonadota bacterium]